MSIKDTTERISLLFAGNQNSGTAVLEQAVLEDEVFNSSTTRPLLALNLLRLSIGLPVEEDQDELNQFWLKLDTPAVDFDNVLKLERDWFHSLNDNSEQDTEVQTAKILDLVLVLVDAFDDTQKSVLQPFTLAFIRHLSQRSIKCKNILSQLNELPSILLNLFNNSTTKTFNDIIFDLLKHINYTPDNLLRLFKPLHSDPDRITHYQHLISSLLQRQGSVDFLFDGPTLHLKAALRPQTNNLTIQFWVKLNDLIDGTILSVNDRFIVKLEGNLFSVYYKGKFVAQFETFPVDPNTYYHVAFIHENHSTQRARAKLRLFINGEFIQQIRCPFTIINDQENVEQEQKYIDVVIGSKTATFELSNLLIVSESLPYEWILLSKFLGRGYKGAYQDANALKWLDYNSRTLLNLKLLDSTNNKSGDLDMNNLSLTIPKSSISLNFNYDSTLVHDDLNVNSSTLTSLKNNILGKVHVNQSQNVSEIFYSIQGIQLLLHFVESSKSVGTIAVYLKVLFELLNSNWKFIEEFESMNGYNILVTLLKLKKVELKENLNIQVLDTVLHFVGYNFQSPFNSVITNQLAYDILVLDFQLWKPINEDSTTEDSTNELSKFLIFQLTVFSRECRYTTFNTLKFKKLKIVKKVLIALSQGDFSENLFDMVQDALITLVKANLTPEVVKLLSSSVIFTLNDKNEEISILVLKVLAEAFLDPLFSNSLSWRKLFGSVSIKWLLLLLHMGKKNKFIVDVGLSMLVKIFTVTSKAYEIFVKNNGLHITLACLREISLNEVEINILIRGSFGQYVYDLNFAKLEAPVDAKLLGSIQLPQLHYLILDALEWTVLNDIFKSYGHDKIIFLINYYIDFLGSAFSDNEGFIKRLETDSVLLKKVCNMVLLLTKPQNATIYFDSAEKLVDVFSNIIITKLFSSDTLSLENYLNSVIIHGEDGLNLTTTIFVVLVFPKVLRHLKDFSSEFESLLQSNSIRFSNIATFLYVLNNELLSFEWDSKDYMGYISVLLSILEAYKNTSKSLRNSHYLQLVKNITNGINAVTLVLRDSESSEQRENFLKVLLFHQENLFSKENLTNEGVSNLIALLLNISSTGDALVTNFSLNCLRIILMRRQEDLSAICSCITFRSYITVMKFLNSILTVNDEDVVSQFLADTKLKAIFDGHLDALGSKFGKKYNKQLFTPVNEVISQFTKTYEDFVKNKYEKLEDLVKLLMDDNETLRLKIISNETMRLARASQDQQDSLLFYITQYNRIKFDVKIYLCNKFDESLPATTWILDHMEGIDRMRKRLLPYDELDSDTTVTNIIEAPGKKQQSETSVRDEPSRHESQSLNSFELIEPDVIDESFNTYNDRNRKVLNSLCPGDKIAELWNVSQVVGLEIIEGILILGQTHIYLIQNYYHKTENDEIIDVNDVPEEERDSNIKLITGQPRPKSSETNLTASNSHSVQTWDLHKLTSVTKRQFLLRDTALELFFSNGSSFLITSIRTKERDSIFSKLSSVATNSNIDHDLSNIFKETNLSNGGTVGSSSGRGFTTRLANVFGAEYLNYLDATKKWQNGEMSNFYYLMIVNTLSGRTFNDLTQYPVFPWVIADYTSDELDFNDPKTFRDLSKPMGAQTPQRAQQFKERYEALQSLEDENAPPFHYGTHYSSAMIVASFLIRLEPFVQSYLLLQGGKFDHADRLFYSIEKAWKSASRDNTTDVRELIPEFYFLPEFLKNINSYDFGKLQDGTKISDVELPKWAKGDPKIFITKNREALESPYVSQHLHKWIDLIFGFKQIGAEAIESINVFNHLSYHGAIDLDSINNEDERRSITGIIHNFGQTPSQIFNKPHPEREVSTVLTVDFTKVKRSPSLIYQTKFKEPIKFLQFKTHSDNSGDAFWRGYPNLYLNGEIEIKPDLHEGSLIVERRVFERLHDEKITILTTLDNRSFITGSSNGVIHIWRYDIVLRGFKESLEFETRLRHHSHPIKELKISPEFNLLLTLDEAGYCYLWDLVRYRFIRSIGDGDSKHVTISYDLGIIGASDGKKVDIFTINGEPVCSSSLALNGDDVITCLNFSNPRTVSSTQLNNNQSHEFWKYSSILTTGWSNGEVKVYELKLIDKLGNWGLELLKTLKFGDTKDSKEKYKNESITIVESYLKGYFNYEEEKTGKIEVIAGDYNGRVAVWR